MECRICFPYSPLESLKMTIFSIDQIITKIVRIFTQLKRKINFFDYPLMIIDMKNLSNMECLFDPFQNDNEIEIL